MTEPTRDEGLTAFAEDIGPDRHHEHGVEHPAGDGLIKPGYDDRLANSDLAPLRKQTWTSYNIFAFWMSDVHSVGGYVTAGALFSLGIASWQGLVVVVIGVSLVVVVFKLGAKASQV